MLHRSLQTLLAAGLALAATAQYASPESVEHDAAGDRYFVSNLDDGTIKQRDQAGNVTPFASVSPDPYGLEILGDTLYACSGGRVKGYLLATGALVFNLNLGGGFLNGITTDGRYLYVTDFSAQRIFRVDPPAATFTTWVASTGGTPNGIVYDPQSDALLVAFWGTGAVVRGYDRATAAITGTLSTGLGNIDGIAIECHGLVVISSWSPNRITRFEWGVASPQFENLLVPGLSQPADIDYDVVHDRICIPSGGNDQVILFDLADCATGFGPARPSEDHIAVTAGPGCVRLSGLPAGDRPIRVLDGSGRLVAAASSHGAAQLELRVPGGFAVVQVQGAGARRVVVP